MSVEYFFKTIDRPFLW